MKTNELKNGDRIRLRNGWYGTIKDNRKGNIRIAEIEGVFTEIGSIYSRDIILYIDKSGTVIEIEHTDAQHKLRDITEVL